MASIKKQVEAKLSEMSREELEALSPAEFARTCGIEAAEKTLASAASKIRKAMLAKPKPISDEEAEAFKKVNDKITGAVDKATKKKKKKKEAKAKAKPKKEKGNKSHTREESLMIELLREYKTLRNEQTLKDLREAFIAQYGTDYDDYRRVQSIVWRLRRKGILNFKKDGNTSLWSVVNLPEKE